jgi:hypothetical protein
MPNIEFAVTGLTKLDVLELKKALSDAKVSNDEIQVEKRALPAGNYGDPSLLTAAIQIATENAQTVLPLIATGIAVWIAKGKTKKTLSGKSIKISSNGLEISTYNADDLSETDASQILPKLTKNLPKAGT